MSQTDPVLKPNLTAPKQAYAYTYVCLYTRMFMTNTYMSYTNIPCVYMGVYQNTRGHPYIVAAPLIHTPIGALIHRLWIARCLGEIYHHVLQHGLLQVYLAVNLIWVSQCGSPDCLRLPYSCPSHARARLLKEIDMGLRSPCRRGSGYGAGYGTQWSPN